MKSPEYLVRILHELGKNELQPSWLMKDETLSSQVWKPRVWVWPLSLTAWDTGQVTQQPVSLGFLISKVREIVALFLLRCYRRDVR